MTSMGLGEESALVGRFMEIQRTWPTLCWYVDSRSVLSIE
jgi:hypothetical protein